MTDSAHTPFALDKLGALDLADEFGLAPEDAIEVVSIVKETLAADQSRDEAQSSAEHFGHEMGSWFPTRNVGVEAAECQRCGMKVWVDTRGNHGGEAEKNQCSPIEGV